MRCSSSQGRMLLVAGLGVAIGAAMAMGCGSSGATSSGSSSDSTDTDSLSTVPTVDLSSYDSTQGSDSSSSISASKSVSKSVGLKEEIPQGQNGTRSSIAGCQADSLKNEMIRLSQQAALEICHPKAAESVGLMTIPSDTFAIYKVVLPADDSEHRQKKCADIPSEDTEHRAACEAGGDKGDMLFRIGNFDGVLKMDECNGGVQTSEATYSVSGTTATASVIRLGDHNKTTEGGRFDLTFEGVKSVIDSVVALDSGGLATASARMSGGFGNGASTIVTDGSVVTLSAVFTANFKDPFTSVTTSSSMRVYAKMGGSDNVGTAKGSFTGSPPPMPISNMIPFDVPAAQKAAFLQMMGNQLGVTLTTSSLLCPNPNMTDPTQQGTRTNTAIVPMVLATNGQCASVTQTFTESFSISNAKEDGNYGRKKITQTYSLIADSASPFSTDVKAFDLSTLSTETTVAFGRAWDCSGEARTIDITSLSAEKKAELEVAMKDCSALEELANHNQGVGGANCQQKMAGNQADQIASAKPVGGVFDGGYTKDNSGGSQAPDKIIINGLSGSDKYCVPDGEGVCSAFSVTSGNATVNISPTINAPKGNGGASGFKISKLVFSAANPPVTFVNVTFVTDLGSTVVKYNKESQIAYTGPAKACSADDLPAACTSKGISDCGKCGDFCRTPGAGCQPH